MTSDPAYFLNRDFTRGGPLQPRLLLLLLLYMVADGNRRGYTEILERFWANAHNLGLDLPQDTPVSSAAFCKARGKLPVSLLRDLIKAVHGKFTRDFSSRYLWKKRRVFAIDGSKFNLNATEELEIEYGKPHAGYHPQVLVCALYDVLAELPVAQVELPYASDERTSLDALLPHLTSGDLLILDAGYPSFEVFHKLQERGIDFLIRVPASFLTVCATRHDRLITMSPTGDGDKLKGAESITLRALRTQVDGESRYFATTIQKSEATHREVTNLYRKRWNVEELYKALKGDTIGQDMFRSKSPEGVVQELLLCTLYVALSRYLIAAARASSPQGKGVGEKRDSLKTAVLALADALAILILSAAQKRRIEVAQQLLERITRARKRYRKGRSFPRISKRPHPRWDARGRRGGPRKG